MSSIIEARIPRLDPVVYVSDYTHSYHIDTNAFKFTTDVKFAKKFEHEEALRISNVLHDYIKSQFRSRDQKENEAMQKQIQVNVVEKKKDDFPSFLAWTLFGVLAFALLRNIAT